MNAGDEMETVLYAHRDGALTCYDHPPTPDRPAWCCVCGEHDLMISWRAHVAQALRDAGYGHVAAAKAEALREAAKELPGFDGIRTHGDAARWLRDRADGLAGEAS